MKDPEEIIRLGERACSTSALALWREIHDKGLEGGAFTFVVAKTDVRNASGQCAYAVTSVQYVTPGLDRREMLDALNRNIGQDIEGKLTVRGNGR
jgi:hypothetical protein